MTAGAKRVIALFLIYGHAHMDEGIAQIHKIVDRMLPGAGLHIIVANNKIDQPYEDTSGEVWEISGDNRLGEFTGWEQGYKYAKRTLNLNSDDLILFANDTFFRRQYRDGGVGYIDFFDRSLVEGRDLTRECIGYLDDFPRTVELMGIRYTSWIRSNVFFIPFDICERLGQLTFPLSEQDIFSSDPQLFWSETAKISNNWKAYISSWLFGKVDPAFPEYQLHWHSAKPVSDENFAFFKKKARAILSEHYLTARLHAMNCPIIDANLYPRLPDRHTAPYYS
ncbi:hypothetical protein [Burkholderia ubonensis]|uniref:hypothetical protein n=1 Tax=Burkholderia ubonensis TaxID=101571 RepID=UPI00075D9357|nr:hypothetical protein [Burkholderia ubonensis]KVC82117.1 hypothetical protein WI75_06680 [Burkholderia ubonensis]KVL83589.1 hypothetical protein WJ50_22730 [Burkholderia ubonensis]